MTINLELTVERWPIAGSFTISRGSKTEAAVVLCILSDNGHVGRGECVPYARYGESLNSVCAEIGSMRDLLINGVSREELPNMIGAGAARNAIDCALWDLEAKQKGTSARQIAGLPALHDLTTAVTISFGDVQDMAASAMAFADRPLIKVKVGGETTQNVFAPLRKLRPRAASSSMPMRVGQTTTSSRTCWLPPKQVLC